MFRRVLVLASTALTVALLGAPSAMASTASAGVSGRSTTAGTVTGPIATSRVEDGADADAIGVIV